LDYSDKRLRVFEAALFVLTLLRNPAADLQMKQQIGWLMQLLVLGALPGLIMYDYTFGFKKLEMPAALLICSAIFMLGTNLRGK
jgi:hypothetical protein